MNDSVEVTRTDQVVSLPKGSTLVSESKNHHARKVSSNVSDGMEWWDISGADGSTQQTISPLEIESRWMFT